MTHGVLVDYRCECCRRLREEWVARPIPRVRTCADCGGSSHRLFGAALLQAVATGPRPAASSSHGSCARGGPGSCVLVPTAARMLDARLKQDNRAIERELAFQERAVRNGELGPTSSLVTTWSGDKGRDGTSSIDR